MPGFCTDSDLQWIRQKIPARRGHFLNMFSIAVKRKKYSGQIFIYIVVAFIAGACLLPFWLVLSGSLMGEKEIMKEGYKIIPAHIDLSAYKVLWERSSVILNGYKISMIVTVVGTLLSLTVSAMLAYPLSLKRVRYRNFFSVFIMITLLFNGGMVPWYIVCVRYLHLRNSIWALIIPYLVNAWNVFLLRNYFQTLPDELHEAARIDGAGEIAIFTKIILPLSIPVMATIALFISIGYWNDWWLGIMLIEKTELQPLQLLLRTIISNIQFLKSHSTSGQAQTSILASLPTEGLKMATCMVTVGPIIFVYPFIQKYFIKGIMMGAIKG
jgi:putative aldouronate transport system permease protein